MLKQSPSRNQRVKGFKVKHAVQISLLLAICLWLVYQLNHSHGKNALEVSSAEKMSGEVQHEHGVLKLGRRGLHPHVEKTSVDVGRHMEKEEESEEEEEVNETKSEEREEEGRRGGEEVDRHDQEKSEEVEDLIEEEDTEREEEGSEEQESEEKGNAFEDQVQNIDTRYSQEAREDQYKGDDASSAVKQNIHTISSQLEIGSLRRVKEEEEDSAENIDKATGEKRGNQLGSVKIDGQTDAGTSANTSEKPKKEQWFSSWN